MVSDGKLTYLGWSEGVSSWTFAHILEIFESYICCGCHGYQIIPKFGWFEARKVTRPFWSATN